MEMPPPFEQCLGLPVLGSYGSSIAGRSEKSEDALSLHIFTQRGLALLEAGVFQALCSFRIFWFGQIYAKKGRTCCARMKPIPILFPFLVRLL